MTTLWAPHNPKATAAQPTPLAVNFATIAPLANDLWSWAQDEHPEYRKMIDAVAAKPIAEADDFALRCLGGIFRRRAAGDLPWLWAVLRESQREVLELAEWITPGDKRICGLWPPAGGTRGAWRQWLRQLEECP